MKKLYTLFIILACLFCTANTFAQTAADGFWLLGTDQTVVATGNVDVVSQTLTGLEVKDYNGGARITGNAQRLQNTAGANWPAETAENFARYVQFQISPKPGFNFTITKISYYKAAYGTHGRMHCNVYYSLSPQFSSSTVIDTTGQGDGSSAAGEVVTFGLPDARDNPVPLTTINLNVVVNDGVGMYFRFFPWYTPGGSGKYLVLQSVKIEGTTSPATAVEELALPTNYSLEQNYPNPFNPATTINYSVPKNSYVKIAVYDVLGNEIQTLVNEEKAPGTYNVNFDASKLTSGIYFYKIQADDFIQTKKMILIK